MIRLRFGFTRFPRGSKFHAATRLAGGLLLGAGIAHAADWPQFLGPDRNGTTSERVAAPWPKDGPRIAWSRAVGAGFAGPVVSGSRVLLHHREGNQEVVEAMDTAKKGAVTWRQTFPATYQDRFGFDEGPRATPAIGGGKVFTFGPSGVLRCLDLETGAPAWSFDAVKELGADQGFFGFACSPLWHDGMVILQVGGRPGAGVVAFDAANGRVRWKATDHEAGYSAPVPFGASKEARLVAFTREGLVVLNPASGAVDDQFPWRSRQHASVNAAAPVVLGRRVFLSSSYDTGAVLLDLSSGKARKVWAGDDSLSSHYSAVVPKGEFLFGFHGRQETGTSLRCVEIATGKVRWSKDGLGCGALIVAGNHLVVVTERGELIVIAAGSEGFQPLARAQILGTGTRAFPALAGGRLYARDPRRMVCVDLSGTE